jgi:hypothetical protein
VSREAEILLAKLDEFAPELARFPGRGGSLSGLLRVSRVRVTRDVCGGRHVLCRSHEHHCLPIANAGRCQLAAAARHPACAPALVHASVRILGIACRDYLSTHL